MINWVYNIGETGAQWKGKVSIDFTLQENVHDTDFYTW